MLLSYSARIASASNPVPILVINRKANGIFRALFMREGGSEGRSLFKGGEFTYVVYVPHSAK